MDARYALVAVVALLWPSEPLLACSLTVNGDGNGGDFADAQLSLEEARLIAFGNLNGLSCLSQAELDQISGESVVPNPLCGTLEPRFNIVAGCGINDADQIGFADSVGVIHALGTNLANGDSIDGRKPGGGRVTLSGGGSAGSTGLLVERHTVATTQPPTVVVRNLIIRDYGGIGIFVKNLRGTVSITGVDVFDNGGAGIQLGTAPGAPNPDCAGIALIGGSGAGEENFIHGNGGWGILINEPCNDLDAVGARLWNNHVGLVDGVGLLDRGNALGGISVFFARNVVIGGAGAGQRNYIGWNDGPGIRIVNSDGWPPSAATVVEGNWIGMARDLPGSARPNATGIELVRGVAIRIGGASAALGNTISGNSGRGIESTAGNLLLDATLIQNNVIGLNPARTAALGNGGDGIVIRAGANASTIRGNVISANGGHGVLLEGGGTSRVEGNVIGLRGVANNANDNSASGNAQAGIQVQDSAGNALLGNRIAANAVFGIRISGEAADANVVRGNVIGLSNGNDLRPNGVGVYIDAGADDNMVGGAGTGDRNTLSASTFEGIRISGANTERNIVRNNRIGTTPSGLGDAGNGSIGVRVDGAAPGTEVVDNLISGNGGDGVALQGSAGTKVQGNTIGLDADGNPLANGQSGVALAAATSAALIGGGSVPNTIAANAGYGVYVADTGTSGNSVRGNLVGGTVPGHGNQLAGVTLRNGASSNDVDDNLILGHGTAPGIEIHGTNTRLNTVRRNRIGLTDAQLVAPNLGGVRVQAGARDNTIGGLAADRNVISGNSQYGVAFSASGTFNTLAGNYIGTSTGGVADRGNGGPGVLLEAGSSETAIRDNVVSGNAGDGVRVQGATTSSNTITRNRIGTDAAGSLPIANDGAGVHVLANAQRTNIGLASSPANSNWIRFNAGPGVWIESGQDHRIRANQVSANGGLGIDLDALGVNANDGPGDADTGANGLQNFPTASNIVRGGGMVSMTLALASTASTDFSINVYHSTQCDPAGHGEGETWLGEVVLSTDANGTGSVAAMFPLADSVVATDFTATATATIGGVERGTSEFSPCAVAQQPPDVVFRDGFESAPGALPAASATRSPKAQASGLERLDHERARFTLLFDDADTGVLPAVAYAIGSERGVVIEAIEAHGADCVLQGVLRCMRGPLAAQPGAFVRVLLRVGPDAAGIWSEPVQPHSVNASARRSWVIAPH